jgi:uncharacterized membrane protein YdbT with pleckstrin-like domain
MSTTDQSQQIQSDAEDGEIVLQTKPTLKPTLVLLTVVIVVGLSIIGALMTSPIIILNDETVNELLMATIGVLMLIITIRLLIHLIVLRRTTYIIRTDSLERETDMIFRYNSRKAPVDELRGFEYSQSIIQTLLGYGSIQLLTAGTNQSLGFLVFENLPNAGEAKSYLEELIN